jgi:hypothetical protein
VQRALLSFAQSNGHVPHHVYRNVPVPA